MPQKAYQVKTLEDALENLLALNEPVSVAALYALSALDRADTAKVRSVWPTIPADRRQVAMQHLRDLSEDTFEVDFGAIYRMGLADDDPIVRATAIDGLWEDDDPALIEPLVKALETDRVEEVRAAAAAALGFFVYSGEVDDIPAVKIKPVVRALKAVFADETEALFVRRRALESLGFMGYEEVGGLIEQGYRHADEEMRQSAVFAMGRSADDRWGETVKAELDSPLPGMRYEAARACGELEYAPALRALTGLVEDVDEDVQRVAVWAMGQIGGDKARAVLTALLESDAEDLHEDVEDALAELEFKGDQLNLGMFDFEDVDEDEEWVLDEVDLDEEDDDDE